jgi:hypothetical protein
VAQADDPVMANAAIELAARNFSILIEWRIELDRSRHPALPE